MQKTRLEEVHVKLLSRLEGHSGSLNGREGGGVVMGVIPPALAGKLSVSWRIL